MTRESIFRRRGGIERAIDGWLDAGVIDAALAERLRTHEASRPPAQTGRLAMAAFGFGGLLIAAGVFLFVRANWQELSPWSRFGVLLAMIAVLHGGGALGARFSQALATSLHAVGTAALGAGIFLAGQIFNLQEHWPEAFLLWALGAAAGVVLLRDVPQVLWLAVLAPAWLVAEWAGSIPFYPALLVGAAESVVPFGLVVLAVAYLSATARGLEDGWRRAVAWLGAVGLLLTAGSLVRLRGLETAVPGLEDVPLPTLLLATGWSVAIVVPLAVAWLLRRRDAWPVAIAAGIAGILIFLDAAVTWQRLCIYLLYAAASIGVVAWGMRDRERLRVNVGVLGFVLTVLSFYFSDLFNMMGRAMGLVGLGLLCIVGGWFAERGRRRLIARLERGAP
jgi:uncharacterized membrane protein